MVADLGLRIATALQPIQDIVLPPTVTARVAAAADVAPAAGLDILVVGGVAATVAVVLGEVLVQDGGEQGRHVVPFEPGAAGAVRPRVQLRPQGRVGRGGPQ